LKKDTYFSFEKVAVLSQQLAHAHPACEIPRRGVMQALPSFVKAGMECEQSN